jgi:collagen type XII alpha
VFNVANFDAIVDIQNEIISQVCSGVDEQLGELVSGEEGECLFLEGGICASSF